MAQPTYSLNEFVVINDNAEVEDSLRGLKCQIKDYSRDDDEYQLYIVEGPHAGKYIWTPSKYIWSWSHFRLVKTIDKDSYLQYVSQIKYANKIRDAIFKTIYGLAPTSDDIDEFSYGRRVRVHKRAVSLKPWFRWSSEMNRSQGEYGKVLGTDKMYNSETNEYEDVIHVEFTTQELFNDYTYSYWFLPEHLELQK